MVFSYVRLVPLLITYFTFMVLDPEEGLLRWLVTYERYDSCKAKTRESSETSQELKIQCFYYIKIPSVTPDYLHHLITSSCRLCLLDRREGNNFTDFSAMFQHLVFSRLQILFLLLVAKSSFDILIQSNFSAGFYVVLFNIPQLAHDVILTLKQRSKDAMCLPGHDSL